MAAPCPPTAAGRSLRAAGRGAQKKADNKAGSAWLQIGKSSSPAAGSAGCRRCPGFRQAIFATVKPDNPSCDTDTHTHTTPSAVRGATTTCTESTFTAIEANKTGYSPGAGCPLLVLALAD